MKIHMLLAIAVSAGTATASPVLAMDQSLVRQFKALDPKTRLEQRCDTEAMERINKDASRFKPDKVIAYAFGDPVIEQNRIKATGAVFRSRGEWYRMTYRCQAAEDHIKVLSFSYTIGSQIPHEQWTSHYLYP